MSGPNDKSSGASDKSKQQENKEKKQSQQNSHGSSNVKVWARKNRDQGQPKKDTQNSSNKSRVGDWNSKSAQQKSFADQKDVYRPDASGRQEQRQSVANGSRADASKKDVSKGDAAKKQNPVDQQKSYADQRDVYRPGISDRQDQTQAKTAAAKADTAKADASKAAAAKTDAAKKQHSADQQKSYADQNDVYRPSVSDRQQQGQRRQADTAKTQNRVDQQKSYADQNDVYRPGVSDRLNQSPAKGDAAKADATQKQNPADRQKSYADQNDVYRPGVSDQQQSCAPVDQKQGKAKDDIVRFPDHVVEVKKLSSEMFNKEQRDGLKDASYRASLNTIEHAQEVSRAVKDFEKYAEGKIKQLEGKVTAGQLAVSLADATLTVLAPEAKLATKVTSEVGKNLVKKIYGSLKKELVESVGNAAKSTSADDLKKVVSTLARQAEDRAAGLRKSVDKAIGGQVNPIKDKLERGKELNPREEAFVGSVFMGNKEQVDRALHEQGFPNPNKAYGNVLRSLVTQFEKHHIKATYSWDKKMTMGFEEWEKNSLNTPGGLAAAARSKADAFVNQRLKERAKVNGKDY